MHRQLQTVAKAVKVVEAALVVALLVVVEVLAETLLRMAGVLLRMVDQLSDAAGRAAMRTTKATGKRSR